MTATAALPPEVAAYLAAVRVALADLPDAERMDVLFDVEASLLEAAREGEGSLAARLGPPDEFTAELRAAAGLQPSPQTPPAARSWSDPLLGALRNPRVAAIRGVARDLAPLWWAARGYVAVVALALLAGVSWLGDPPAVPRFGDGLVGLAAIVVAVAGSLALGVYTRRRRGFGRVLWVANAALVVAAVPVAVHLSDYGRAPTIVTFAAPPSSELTYRGLRVDNIYPYSRDGRLLHDVLLYDGAGRPLEIARDFPDPLRRVVRTAAGRALFNVFPIRYFEAGSARIANPNAAPPTRVPRIATRPLASRGRARR